MRSWLHRTEEGELKVGEQRTHLGSDSSLISKFHTGWRIQSIRAIERNPKLGLHYSSVVSLSLADYENLKEELIAAIKRAKEVILHSKEEELCCFSLDFFRL